MASSASSNLPPGKTLETVLRTALAEEEVLYRQLDEQKVARESQLNDARSSADWLSSALGTTRVVPDSSADVVSVLGSFINNLSSVMSIHGSDQIFGDLKQSLPIIDAAKRSWESVAGIVNDLMVQIENLNLTTSSHAKSMDTELEAHKMIAHQSQISLDSLRQSTDALSHCINHKRGIIHPIRRVPTEILEHIFELAVLEERSTLRGNFVGLKALHESRDALLCTIPRVPIILASTCRRWRDIALNMALLWDFIRVPTVEKYNTRSCVVGRSAFQQAISRIGTSKCEVVLGPTLDWNVVKGHLPSIPSSQISVMNVVSPHDGMDFSQIPTARIFRIIRKGPRVLGRYDVLPPYVLPASVLASTTELDCYHALPVINAPIYSVTSFSLSLNDHVQFPNIGHIFANFPNLTALGFSTMHSFTTFTLHGFTPLHHARIRTLSVTDAVIPQLGTLLQRGALSLPSLTHFIILNMYSGGGWDQLRSLFVKVTHFDIRAATHLSSGTHIRELLDLMPLLQQFSVFGTAVDLGLVALTFPSTKRIDNLVIADSDTNGSIVDAYYNLLLGPRSAGHTSDSLGVSIRFVNCPHVLPQVRERLSSMTT
jgi:hypothetical protein